MLSLFRPKNVTQQCSDQFGFFALPFISDSGGNVANGIQLDGLHSGISQLGLDVLCALALDNRDAQGLNECPEISLAGIRLESETQQVMLGQEMNQCLRCHSLFDRLGVHQKTAVSHAYCQRGFAHDGAEIRHALVERTGGPGMTESIELGGFQQRLKRTKKLRRLGRDPGGLWHSALSGEGRAQQAASVLATGTGRK